MKPVSKIAEAVRASTTLAVDSLAKQMKADGLDVVGLARASPISILLTTSTWPVSELYATAKLNTPRQQA